MEIHSSNHTLQSLKSTNMIKCMWTLQVQNSKIVLFLSILLFHSLNKTLNLKSVENFLAKLNYMIVPLGNFLEGQYREKGLKDADNFFIGS